LKGVPLKRSTKKFLTAEFWVATHEKPLHSKAEGFH